MGVLSPAVTLSLPCHCVVLYIWKCTDFIFLFFVKASRASLTANNSRMFMLTALFLNRPSPPLVVCPWQTAPNQSLKHLNDYFWWQLYKPLHWIIISFESAKSVPVCILGLTLSYAYLSTFEKGLEFVSSKYRICNWSEELPALLMTKAYQFCEF